VSAGTEWQSDTSAPETRDRRGGRARGDTGLLERGPELEAIDRLLESSVENREQALLISGDPGLGKTRLHGVALDRARARGLLVLRAAGSELERDVAFGVAGQLLRGWVAAMPGDERAGALREAPERVRELYGDGPALDPAGAEDGLALSHGLFSVLAAAAEARPVLLAIDDLQWCDNASLGFVQYLLHRLGELSLALLLASRPPGAEGDALDSIAAHPAVRVLTLAPLGRQGVREIVSRRLGTERADALTDTCMRTTGGNPFYLQELLLALGEDLEAPPDQLEEHARSLAPESVIRSLRVRIGRLGPDAGALARAVAILGDDVPLRTAAALAELEVAKASDAADALGSVNVLMAREPLRFVHPLIRTALEQDIPSSQRATRHLEAARLVAGEGESVERVAAHLLRGRPEADPWAVEQLRTAAAEARSRGAPLSAVRYLERALAEPAPSEQHATVLAELGAAEAAVGLESADEHLALAARASTDPWTRAEIALVRGGTLYAQARHEEAAKAYQDGLDQLAEVPADEQRSELRDRLRTALVLSAATVPSLQGEARRLSAEVIDADPRAVPTQSQRLLLAQATVEAAFGGRPADVVIDLATRAWDEGRLLERATPYGASWTLVTAAFCLAGELELSIETAEAAAANARERSAPLAFATATHMRALPQLWQGNVDGALADLELARDARRYGWRQYARSAAANYCLCMIEKGKLDGVEAVLVEDAPLTPPYLGEDPVRLYALAELRRAQGRLQEAYETALSAGEAAEAAIPYLGYCPWAASAAQSALALGQRDRAGELIQRELTRLQTTQVLHERIRALRLAGLCEGGESGLAKLREAVDLGEAHPPRLETIHALIALGSALRRGKQRAESRPPLERAFDLAGRGGATVLYELARTELAAAGARPRREALTGPGSLTASELRIAQLAAAGHSNREIATTLFVTPKTVEYHLRNCYRKLDIQTRRELARALAT
jgi:DNA-binding CsgD family transcriptional regulator